VLISTVLNRLKASTCSLLQIHLALFFVSQVMRTAIPENPGIKRRYQEAILRNWRTLRIVVGAGQLGANLF